MWNCHSINNNKITFNRETLLDIKKANNRHRQDFLSPDPLSPSLKCLICPETPNPQGLLPGHHRETCWHAAPSPCTAAQASARTWTEQPSTSQSVSCPACWNFLTSGASGSPWGSLRTPLILTTTSVLPSRKRYTTLRHATHTPVVIMMIVVVVVNLHVYILFTISLVESQSKCFPPKCTCLTRVTINVLNLFTNNTNYSTYQNDCDSVAPPWNFIGKWRFDTWTHFIYSVV